MIIFKVYDKDLEGFATYNRDFNREELRSKMTQAKMRGFNYVMVGVRGDISETEIKSDVVLAMETWDI